MARTFLTGWIDRVVVKTLRPIVQHPQRILRDHVKPRMSVLDAGCGTGYFSLGMARLVGPRGSVVCVDVESDNIDSLKRKARSQGLLERLDPRVCTEDSLGIDDWKDRIDFALAFYVVHHARHPNTLMAEVYQALGPGTRFLVVEPKHHASDRECRAIEGMAQQAGFILAGQPRFCRSWAVLLARP